MTAVAAWHAWMDPLLLAGPGISSMALVPDEVVPVAGLVYDDMHVDYQGLPDTDSSAAQTSAHLVKGPLAEQMPLAHSAASVLFCV